MRMGNVELRHIIDVDGQLIGIDAEVVDAATVLRRAGRKADRSVFMVRAGERIAMGASQAIRLSEDEVLFFETVPARLERVMTPASITRMAA